MTASAEPLSVGDSYKLPYTLTADDPAFNNWAGVTVTTTVTRPDGTADSPTVTPGTPVGPTRTYTAVGSCSQAGTWLYKFAATGALTETTEGQFVVGLAATADVYCTVGEVRGHLGDTSTSPKLDTTLLQRAVTATARAIDRYCSGGIPGSRRFWRDPAPVPHTFWTDDPARAWVDDISTTTGLLVKTDEDGDGTFETTWTIGTDFQLEPLNAELAGVPFAWWEIVAIGQRRFPLYPQRAGLQATTRWGWSGIPIDVNQAAILKAAKLFKRTESPDGFASGFADFGAVRISRYEDPDVAMLLEPYLKRRTRSLNYTPQRLSLFHGGR
jgi:hypothetical protein